MFYSSSFFDGFWFLIRSPTKNPLKLGRKYQMVIFAPQPCNGQYPMKKTASKKVLTFEKVEQKSPSFCGPDFKIGTGLAVRGFLHPSFKIRINSVVQESLRPILKYGPIWRFVDPCLPMPKYGPIWRFVDPCIPI